MEGVVGRAHQGGDRPQDTDDDLPLGTKRGKHGGDRAVVIEGVEDRLHPGLQLADGAVVVPQLCGPSPLAPAGGRALEVPEDDVEDVDDVVAGAGGEHVDKGDQSGDPALGGKVGQLGGPGVLCVAGQGGHPPGRNGREIKATDAQGADLAQALERLHQPGDGGAERRPPEAVKVRAALALRHHQERFQGSDDLGRASACESRPQPLGGPLPDAAHQPGEDLLSW